MTAPEQSYPNPSRLAFGFLLAPLVPTVLYVLWDLISTDWFTGQRFLGWVMLIAIYGAVPSALILGVPAYFILRRYLKPRFITFVLVGGVIAALPWLLLSLLPGKNFFTSYNSCKTVIDGARTWCDYLEVFKFSARNFAFGSIGGAVFWLCTTWRMPRFAWSATQPHPTRRTYKVVMKWGALAYLLTYLVTCEALPWPTHSYCSRDQTFVDAHEVLLRAIREAGIGRRKSYFPDAPDQTAEEIYAANPNNWTVTRTLSGWTVYGETWAITVSEHLDNVEQPGSWEGTFYANNCGHVFDSATMPTYGRPSSSRK